MFRDGFESLGLAPGAYTWECCGGEAAVPGWRVRPGWTGSWFAGLYNPAGSGRFAQAGPLPAPADGTTYAYVQTGVWVSELQPAAGRIAAGATYTLSAAIGAELGDGTGAVNSSGWELRLYAGDPAAGGALVAALNKDSAGAAPPAPGGWALNTLAWVATPAAAGRTLWVGLGLNPPGTPNYNVANFDNVALSAAPGAAAVPAAPSALLLGAGLLGLAGVRLRGATIPA